MLPPVFTTTDDSVVDRVIANLETFVRLVDQTSSQDDSVQKVEHVRWIEKQIVSLSRSSRVTSSLLFKDIIRISLHQSFGTF